MTADEIETLAKRLGAIRHMAEVLNYAAAGFEGVWNPEPKKCHENASTWADGNEGWKAIRGWLVIDFTDSFLIPKPVVHFIAHSIVRRPDGSLWDITPSEATQQYPFVAHPGTDEEFREIVEVHRLAAVDYFPPP